MLVWLCDLVIVWLWDCLIVWLCDQVIFMCAPLNFPSKIHTFRNLTFWKWTELAKMAHDRVIVWLHDYEIVWLCDQVIFLCAPMNFPAKMHTFGHLTCWKWAKLTKMAHACVIALLCDCVIAWLCDCVIAWNVYIQPTNSSLIPMTPQPSKSSKIWQS